MLGDALSADYGISVIYTGEGTKDIPDYRFQYSSGLVIKRHGSDIMWIILMPHTGTQIAYNRYVPQAGWDGWRFIETINQ